jgi:hypothetical protein
MKFRTFPRTGFFRAVSEPDFLLGKRDSLGIWLVLVSEINFCVTHDSEPMKIRRSVPRNRRVTAKWISGGFDVPGV